MCNRRDHAAVINKFKSRFIAMFHTFDKTTSDLDSVFHALRLIQGTVSTYLIIDLMGGRFL